VFVRQRDIVEIWHSGDGVESGLAKEQTRMKQICTEWIQSLSFSDNPNRFQLLGFLLGIR
jgi:hypothetical protein